MDSSPGRKLAVVVGAGVAGCQAARALLRAGYDALVLEQGRGLGGVWRRNYHSFGLQVPWCCYTFPEFPYDKAPRELAERVAREVYPSGETIKDYIGAYCAHFDLERHMVYGAKVVHLASLPGNRWSVRFRQATSPGQCPQSGALKIMEADVVVLATGMYYSPYVPSVPGLASFKGTVMHARDFVSVEGLKGKRVLVLGAGKSATDCSVVAASPAAGAAAVTTLFRQAHWPLPRELFGMPFHRLVYTRFTAAMLPMYYTGQGQAAKRLKHGLLSPLKRLFWSTLESHVAKKMQLQGHLRPELDFVQDLFFGGQIQDGMWNEAVNAGRISAVQGSVAEVRPGGVRLADGTSLDCDVIIFATGYTKDYSLFDAATAMRLMAAVGSPSVDAGLHLYRSIVSPWVSNLFFIGCEASSFNNVLTSGLQSLWMMHHLTGRLNLPGAQELMKDIQLQRAWRKSVMPSQYYCASSIMLYQQRYHDQLVRDLGHQPKRKRAARLGASECFGLYTAEDYAELFTDGAMPGLAAAVAAVPPPRPAAAVVAAAVTLMPAAASIGARLDLAVMPDGAERGIGGSAAAAAAPAVPRAKALMSVCTEHSDAVALAVAPGEESAAPASQGLDSAFVSSLDGPALMASRPGPPSCPATMGAATFVPALTPAAAAPPPGPSVRQLRAPEPTPHVTVTAVSATDLQPQISVGGGGATATVVAATAAAAADTRMADGCRSSANIVGGHASSALSEALPSASASVVDGGGGATGGGCTPSVFSTNTALAASSVAGSVATVAPSTSAVAAAGPSPRPRMTLAHRVRLQVLHLVNRSGSGQMPGGSYGGSGGEEVLEFRLASNTTRSGRVVDSLAAAGTATHTNTNASSSLWADKVRHAAPNAYSEVVGTLEVH